MPRAMDSYHVPISLHFQYTRGQKGVTHVQIPHGLPRRSWVAGLFDVYTSALPAGKKNLAYILVYQAADRLLKDAEALLNEAGRLYPRMTRIFIHPDWVGLLDFETRLPSAVERAIERAQADARE